MKRDREKVYIYGKHALKEALLNAPRVIRKVFLAHEVNDPELRKTLRSLEIPVTPMKSKEADRMVGEDTAHQGVIAVADPSALLADFNSFMDSLTVTRGTMLVLLDELTDPHNVGAIIRSAAAFGAAGVLMPAHNQVRITGAVVKASVGMVFRLPLVAIGNVNHTLDALKKKGFWTYALEMEGKNDLSKEVFDAPAVFIVGNEGRGIRQKTMERADITLRIPMNPRAESLNASVSAAVVLYEWSKQHKSALK